MKKYFKARGLKENYDPQNKHKDIFYFAEDTGQLLLDGVSYSEATDLTPYAKAPNLPDSVISNVGIYNEGGAHIYIKSTKDNLIDGSHDEIKVEIPIAEKHKVGLIPIHMYSKIDGIPNAIVGEDSLGPIMSVSAGNTAVWLNYNEYYFIDDSNKEVSLEIPVATTELCGVMAPEDKVKLDSLVNYQAGDNINIKDGVINANTWIQFEMLDFVKSDSNQHTYNYNGIVIKDGSFSGSGSGIVFDKADIKYRTYTTSPNGVSTVCFALNDDIRRKIDNAITSISINNIEQVNTNGAVDLTIPNATTSKEGLMSKEDKTKLNSPINYYYRDSGVDTKLTNFSNNICYVGSPVLEILGNKVKFEGAKLCTLNGIPFIDCSVPKAVASLLDGLMSKEDKAKLDSQPTIKASDATGVTDDDYVVIKKSEYQSILDRLSALEGS